MTGRQFFEIRRKQLNFLVYGQDCQKKLGGSVGKIKIFDFKVGIFSKIIFCIANIEEKPATYNLL